MLQALQACWGTGSLESLGSCCDAFRPCQELPFTRTVHQQSRAVSG